MFLIAFTLPVELPAPLTQFIAEAIDSIETLEILLLLHRSPETFWAPSAVESHLGLKKGIAEKRLAGLAQKRLAVRGEESGGYRYRPENDERRKIVAELAAAYSDKRASVVNTVFSENLARLRAFANAFKVKGE